MRLLFLAWNFPPAKGGIEYVAWHLVAGLRTAGDDVRVVARHSSVGVEEQDVIRPPRAGLPTYLWFSLVRSWGLLRKCPADLIVCPGIVTAPVAWVLSKRFRTPYVVLAHGSDVTHGGMLCRAVIRYFFNAAGGVASNSRSTARLMDSARCRAARLQVIHPGVQAADYPLLDAARRAEIRQMHGLSGRRVIFSLGRLIRRKGILEFVENVMPDLARDCPEVLLVVVGGDAKDSLVHKEGMMAQIRNQVVSRGLDRNVRLLGASDDTTVRDLHYAADVHILPALRMKNDVEGFGIVLLEAALAEVPVVATRVGGIPEAVEEGETGLLVEAEDWAGMRNAVRTLLLDKKLGLEMGRKGRCRALSQFDWPVIAGEYRAFFAERIAGKGNP